MKTDSDAQTTVSKTYFVVTRDNRRTSDKNFLNESDAKAESQYWINLCKRHDPSSKISIVRTDKPKKIR